RDRARRALSEPRLSQGPDGEKPLEPRPGDPGSLLSSQRGGAADFGRPGGVPTAPDGRGRGPGRGGLTSEDRRVGSRDMGRTAGAARASRARFAGSGPGDRPGGRRGDPSLRGGSDAVQPRDGPSGGVLLSGDRRKETPRP